MRLLATNFKNKRVKYLVLSAGSSISPVNRKLTERAKEIQIAHWERRLINYNTRATKQRQPLQGSSDYLYPILAKHPRDILITVMELR